MSNRRKIGDIEIEFDGAFHGLVGTDGGLVFMRDRDLGRRLWQAAERYNALQAVARVASETVYSNSYPPLADALDHAREIGALEDNDAD